MADASTIYNGVSSEREANIDLGRICDGGLQIGGACWGGEWKDIAEPINAAITAVNNRLAETKAAVRVPYQPGTDRTQWLKERIDAVDTRVDFIRSRVSDLLTYLKSINGDAAVILEKAYTAALSLVPGIGSVIKLFEGGAQAARDLDSYKTQTLIQQYTEDVKELAAIRKQLQAEYTKVATPTTTTTTTTPTTPTPTADAPNPNTVYYWYAGAALLVLLLLYWSRTKKRT